MTIGTQTPAGLWTRNGLHLGYLVLAVVAAAVGTATYAIFSSTAAHHPSAAEAAAFQPPAPAEFAREFLGLNNAYARAHGDPARLANADCVQASPGHYMCSYAVRRPNRASECHIMQAMWTPRALSSFTVTLSGRAERCGSLREALQSLR